LELFQWMKLVEKGQKVLIIVDDHTRPTRVDKVLPYVLEELRGVGIKDISILIAQGIHRKMNS